MVDLSIITIELEKPLPSAGIVGTTYKIEGKATLVDMVGAPPWLYAEVRLKEWYKPEVAEEITYIRAFPMPVGGGFSVDFTPEEEGEYEVTVVATPAPLSLPVIGVPPITGASKAMKMSARSAWPAAFRFSEVVIDGNSVPLLNKDVDSRLLLDKAVTGYLEVNPTFEWTGPEKEAVISIKAGYRDFTMGFTPKTPAFTGSLVLPASPETPTAGSLPSPVKVPLAGCEELTDGALEIVAKLPGEPDYISHIWNVYVTKPPEEKLNFDLSRPSVSKSPVNPGERIDITCPVISRCTLPVDAEVKVIIYEGSALPTHGREITDYNSGVFRINPSMLQEVIVHHVAVAGTIDRRDIEVEVSVDSHVVKESEWDDVYYVGVELELLEVKIDPPGGGSVTTDPAPVKGTENNWYFAHGTTVYVTAYPNPGYTFASWSGEMTDTTAITAGVYPMTEKRTITAHFKKELTYTLNVAIEPAGAGSVIKSPDKASYVQWEQVSLTALPAPGYEFDHWSGDASGYSTSTSVAMTEDKRVIANFKKVVPPPSTVVSFTVKGDGFPFATSYWKLYHYDDYGNIWEDYTLHRPGDVIRVNNVRSAGYLSCFCCSAFTGEWSEQFYSRRFAAIDGEDYRYDIASGIVYYR